MIKLENTEITINREQFLCKSAEVIDHILGEDNDTKVMLLLAAFAAKLGTLLFDEDYEDDEVDEDDTEDNHIHH